MIYDPAVFRQKFWHRIIIAASTSAASAKRNGLCESRCCPLGGGSHCTKLTRWEKDDSATLTSIPPLFSVRFLLLPSAFVASMLSANQRNCQRIVSGKRHISLLESFAHFAWSSSLFQKCHAATCCGHQNSFVQTLEDLVNKQSNFVRQLSKKSNLSINLLNVAK